VAVIAVLIAFLIREVLVRGYGELPHYVTFYPVVLLVAVLSGLWPGVLATTVSALVALYWIIPPKGEFTISRASDAIGLAIFCTMGVCVSVVAELYHRNRRRLAAYEKSEAVWEERRKATEALRESEKQFRELAEGIPQLAWTANPDGWIYWYNQRWYQYTGTSPQQMEGWGWQSVHDPNELPKVLERWTGSIASGEPFDMEFPLRGADGVFRPFLTRVMPLRDTQGRVLRWFGTNTDISEQRRTEKALREQAELLRLSFDAIIVWRLNGVIESWNLGAEQLYGYLESEALGCETHELLRTVHPVPWPRIEAELCEKRCWEGELHHFTKEGREVVVSARKQLIRGVDGVERVLETNRDITERKRAEETLRTSLEEKTALLKEVHHRVKNNLQIVSSLLNLQARQVKNPAALETLRDTQGRIRSMALLHETLYREGNASRVNCAVYFSHLCAHLCRAFGQMAERVRVRTDIAPVELGLDIAIPCGLIVNELVSNSFKHAFPDGRRGEITVKLCTQDDGQVVLSVTDDGIGLSSDVDYQQTGTLGMQLVTGLAKQVSAAIEVKSAPGTMVRISFSHPEKETPIV
jgi:PAS domain S-box-containing protein